MEKKISVILEKANEGDAFAQYQIALAYFLGDDLPKDYQKAYHYFVESATNHNFDAYYMVGYCNQFAYGTEKNLERALSCYTIADKYGKNNKAKQYIDVLSYQLGKIDKETLYCRALKSMEEAKQASGTLKFSLIESYKNSFITLANQGHTLSEAQLSYLYQQSDFGKNDNKAFEYAKKAADKGNMNSQFQLGHFYENGIGTIKDKTKAIIYYEKAYHQGMKEALLAIQRLKEPSKPVTNGMKSTDPFYFKYLSEAEIRSYKVKVKGINNRYEEDMADIEKILNLKRTVDYTKVIYYYDKNYEKKFNDSVSFIYLRLREAMKYVIVLKDFEMSNIESEYIGYALLHKIVPMLHSTKSYQYVYDLLKSSEYKNNEHVQKDNEVKQMIQLREEYEKQYTKYRNEIFEDLISKNPTFNENPLTGKKFESLEEKARYLSSSYRNSELFPKVNVNLQYFENKQEVVARAKEKSIEYLKQYGYLKKD